LERQPVREILSATNRRVTLLARLLPPHGVNQLPVTTIIRLQRVKAIVALLVPVQGHAQQPLHRQHIAAAQGAAAVLLPDHIPPVLLLAVLLPVTVAGLLLAPHHREAIHREVAVVRPEVVVTHPEAVAAVVVPAVAAGEGKTF